jgi:hypothetical protein
MKRGLAEVANVPNVIRKHAEVANAPDRIQKHAEVADGPNVIRKCLDLKSVAIGTDEFLLFEWNGQLYAELPVIINTPQQILPRSNLDVSWRRISDFKDSMEHYSFATDYDCNKLNKSGILKTKARFIRKGSV